MKLSRYQLLAAEIFGYSYANYHDHLGIGNIRYDSLMPRRAAALESALLAEWPIARVAQELEVDPDTAASLLTATRDALQVVDADNPAESYRQSVRQLVKNAAAEGLNDDAAIEQLVIQLCFRAADLAYLTETEGSTISQYTEDLRWEPDDEYYEDYFEEED